MSDTLYCSRPAPQDGRKSCGEYGAYYVRLEKVRHDEATHIFKQVYNCLQNRYRRTKTPENSEGNSRLKAETEEFLVECRAWKRKVRAGDAAEMDYISILPAIGHMKLADIRPQHLNLLYEQLSQTGIRGGFTEKAYTKVDFKALLKEKGLTMHGLEVKLPGNKHHSILNLCSGGAVKAETAKMIADVLEMPATAIFRYETDSRPLSGSTVGGYHTLVSTILAQAEMEMLIPYNPAAKATPPKADDPGCLQ